METFDYTVCEGTEYEKTYKGCYFVGAHYNNGNLALLIEHPDYGRFATCTVNPGDEIAPIALCIKNYSENEGMDKFLVKMGIVHPQVNCYKQCGWVEVPFMFLTEKGRKIFENLPQKNF